MQEWLENLKWIYCPMIIKENSFKQKLKEEYYIMQ